MSDRLSLPEDIVVIIRAFAGEASKQKRLLAYVLVDFLDDIPQGKRMVIYDLIADEWSRLTGDDVSGRTVRFWVQSVKTYTKEQLRTFAPLSDAQLIEAVRLASDCQKDATPQEICEWAVREQVQTVAQMRAEWLPQTGDRDHVDPPGLIGVVKWLNKLFSADNPHRKRIEEIITELRGYLMEVV